MPSRLKRSYSSGAALSGVTALVHSASVVHRPGATPDEYDRFNREGTRALLAAARAAGVRHFVFLSSIKVYGDTPIGTVDESTPVDPQDPYAASKVAAERLVLGEGRRMVTSVLRLSPVFGRGDKGNVRRVITAIARRRFLLPGDGSTRKSLVHVSTVAEVVRAVLAQARPGVFVVADSEAPSMRQLANAAAAALGRTPPFCVPAALLTAAALPIELGARMLRRDPPVSRALVWKSLQTTVCSPRKAEEELRLSCHVDLREAVRDEASWLREESLI